MDLAKKGQFEGWWPANHGNYLEDNINVIPDSNDAAPRPALIAKDEPVESPQERKRIAEEAAQERKRIAQIMRCPEASINMQSAWNIALESQLTVPQARALLREQKTAMQIKEVHAYFGRAASVA